MMVVNLDITKRTKMKPVQNWLDEYAESHQNPANIKIHWICVPLIDKHDGVYLKGKG